MHTNISSNNISLPQRRTRQAWKCVCWLHDASQNSVLSQILDIRATTNIITNLLYLSPTRHLLYVTDTVSSTFERRGSPTHVFEHLSCFLPGLFALGAHTLPLDKLDLLGIDLIQLGASEDYGYAAKAYRRLSSYNLKELHLWAAEGLAQTCWLTYADQPTGLGPDEVVMKFTPKTLAGNRYQAEADNYLWINALDKWKKSGSRGGVPGLKEKQPIIYTEDQRLNGKASERDYFVKKTGYLLRPEVSRDSIMSIHNINPALRLWNHFSCCGR